MNANQPCLIALSSDSELIARLYPDVNGNFNYRAPPQCHFSIAIKAEMKNFALREGIQVGRS